MGTKPCRDCGAEPKSDSGGTFDGWSAWVICKCGKSVSADGAHRTLAEAEQHAERLWNSVN